jgi:hypothetical protein
MTATRENHEIIGMQLTYDVGEWANRCLERFVSHRMSDLTLNDAKEDACMVHLGFVAPDKLPDIVRQAADCAVEYFEKGDTREINSGWYHPLFYGLLLCLLIGDERKIVSLCSWATPTKRLEYEGAVEDEIQWLYLVLASFFQEKPDKRFEKLRAKIAACRTKNVRVLSHALDAVAERDQADFAKAIEACVRHHMTKPKPKPDGHFMEYWLPLHANVIYLAGLHLGLDKPAYPPEIAAYLMTPASVGFGV